MFDKITKTVIEAVYVDNAKNSANFIEKTFAACASIIPIMLSLTSLLVAYWAYSANQEGMAVVVRRDKEAELGVGSPDVAIGPAERTDIAYIATWQISIVNTSLTATIPLTGYMIKDVSAYGAYVVLHSGSTKLAARMIYSSGANITLPLSLKPGEVVNFVLKPPFLSQPGLFQNRQLQYLHLQ